MLLSEYSRTSNLNSVALFIIWHKFCYLLHLLIREQDEKDFSYSSSAERAPFYMVKVIIKQGTDSEWFKHHRSTLEILKTLEDLDFVLEVTGDYTWQVEDLIYLAETPISS